MAIEITSTKILKPCKSPPHPLKNTLVPLTIFDLAAMDLHVITVRAFQAPMPPSSEILKGLSRALVYFPHLAGRLTVNVDSGHPCILLNNVGVRVVEARVNATLAEKMPLEETTNLRELHPSFEGVEELFQVQLTSYACGGVVMGFTSYHRTGDGQSMGQFLVSWAEMVRNPSTPVVPSPIHDRASFFIPRNSPRSNFNHLDIEFRQINSHSSDPKPTIKSPVTNFKAHFSADFIAELKSKIPYRSSTFECLLAHVWSKITIARGLNEEEFTSVRIAVNGRARMRPTVPMNYFGNLVLWAHPKVRARELVRSDNACIVNVIRDAVSRINDEYFKSFIDFGEIIKREGGNKLVGSAPPQSGSALCPNLEVDSWLGMNLHELDFGSGRPCAFLPPNLPVDGVMVFVPSCQEKSEVNVFIDLFEDHMKVFKKICYEFGEYFGNNGATTFNHDRPLFLGRL